MRRLSREAAQTNMVLDCSENETFVIDMVQSIDNLNVRNVTPGRLYVIVAVQDETGQHTLSWNSRLRNAITIDTEPESVSVQCFVGRTGTLLEAVPPGTWSSTASQGIPGPPGPQGPAGPQGPVGPAGPAAQIIQVADEATAIAQSAADPANFYFWV